MFNDIEEEDLVDKIAEMIQEHPAVCQSDAYDTAWNIVAYLKGEDQ